MYILALSPKELEHIKQTYKVEEDREITIEIPYKLVNFGFFQTIIPDKNVNKITGRYIIKTKIKSQYPPHIKNLFHHVFEGYFKVLKIPYKNTFILIFAGDKRLADIYEKYNFPDIPDNCFFT